MPDLLDNPQLAGAPDFMSRAGALLQAAIDAGYSQEDAYNMYMAPARLAQRVLEESSPSPRATIQQPREFAPVTDADTEKMTNAVNSYYASVKAGQDPSLAMTRVMVGPAREVMRAGWKRQEAAKQKAVEDSAEFNRLNREYILGQKELAMSEKDRRTTEEAAAGIMRDELGSGNDPNVVMSEIGPHLSGKDFRYLNGLVMKQAGGEPQTVNVGLHYPGTKSQDAMPALPATGHLWWKQPASPAMPAVPGTPAQTISGKVPVSQLPLEAQRLFGIIPAGGGTNVPSGVPVRIPDAAIQHLRAHPELKAAFDAKYGAGSADLYLQ